MSTQPTPEALRLAAELEGDYCPDWLYETGVDEIAAELRRLHDENAQLREQNTALDAACAKLEAVRGTPATGGEPPHVPHTCAGFVGAYVSLNGRQPSQQDVWDAAIRSYRDLHPSPQPVREPLPDSYQGSVLTGVSDECAVTFRFGNRADAEAWHDAITDGWDSSHGITGGQHGTDA